MRLRTKGEGEVDKPQPSLDRPPPPGKTDEYPEMWKKNGKSSPNIQELIRKDTEA